MFFFLFTLFCRFIPMVAIAEVKSILPQANPHGDHGGGDHDHAHGHAHDHAHANGHGHSHEKEAAAVA